MLRASAGQTMTISAAWVAYPYQVSVISPNSQLLGVADAGSSWSGALPVSGDYMLIVQPGVSNARVYYNFVLSITGSTAPTATPQPTTAPPNVQRIQFAPGATSATVYGTLYPNQQQQYVLRALAGQSMTVVTSSTGPFRLVISGADGTSLGTINANQSLTVYLPSTQDYFLVLVPTSGAAVNYTLQVTVVGSTPPPTPTPVKPPQTQRITFAPGAVSATVAGYADAGRPASYVLRAMAGQDMTVQIYGSGPYNATLTGADGTFLGSANSQGTISARLPRTQDYYITISVPSGAPGFNFSMVVTVVGSGPTPADAGALDAADHLCARCGLGDGQRRHGAELRAQGACAGRRCTSICTRTARRSRYASKPPAGSCWAQPTRTTAGPGRCRPRRITTSA